MKEKYKIYIVSVLSHCAVAAVAHLIFYVIALAWPELSPRYSSSSRLVNSFLIHCGVGLVVLPFFTPYEPVYRYFFKADREKKQSDR